MSPLFFVLMTLVVVLMSSMVDAENLLEVIKVVRIGDNESGLEPDDDEDGEDHPVMTCCLRRKKKQSHTGECK
jgi:hypothetical protein